MITATDLLAELETRAGASDKDRDLWLAERAGGITATEIRELYLRKITVQQLIDLKLGRRVDTFSGNQYTAWGNKREPELAEVARKVYGIKPESRVFHAADNPRFLASPDGIGVVDRDGQVEGVVEEIKTGKDPITTRDPGYAKKGYGIQQQWSMRVTGFGRSLYVSEQHDSDWQDRGGEYFEPQPLGLVPVMEWVEYDEQLVKELEVLAIGFLVALDAAAAGDAPQYDEELDTMAVNVLRFREEESSAKKAKEQSWDQLQEALRSQHDELSQESPLARITWRAAASRTVVELVPTQVVNEEAAKADRPVAWTHLELCRKELEEATQELAAAQADWDLVLAKFTATENVPTSTTETSKESLTVMSVKPKKETKK
jgi:hypothetical protein